MSADAAEEEQPKSTQAAKAAIVDDLSSLSSLSDSESGDARSAQTDGKVSEYLTGKKGQRSDAEDDKDESQDDSFKDSDYEEPAASTATTSRKAKTRPAKARKKATTKKAKSTSITTAAAAQPEPRPGPAPSPAPLLEESVKTLGTMLRLAREEAGGDAHIQTMCWDSIDNALAQLPTDTHKRAMCLMMNRYAAFCASPGVDVPVFPLTVDKIVLFLARCLDNPLGRRLRDIFPQPARFPLPVANDPEVPMGMNEGTVVTRELVRSWLEALGYAMTHTRAVWISLVRREQMKSIAELLAEPVMVELVSLVPPAEMFEGGQNDDAAHASVAVSPSDTSSQKAPATKWTKGGKAVSAPVPRSDPNSALPSPLPSGSPVVATNVEGDRSRQLPIVRVPRLPKKASDLPVVGGPPVVIRADSRAEGPEEIQTAVSKHDHRISQGPWTPLEPHDRRARRPANGSNHSVRYHRKPDYSYEDEASREWRPSGQRSHKPYERIHSTKRRGDQHEHQFNGHQPPDPSMYPSQSHRYYHEKSNGVSPGQRGFVESPRGHRSPTRLSNGYDRAYAFKHHRPPQPYEHSQFGPAFEFEAPGDSFRHPEAAGPSRLARHQPFTLPPLDTSNGHIHSNSRSPMRLPPINTMPRPGPFSLRARETSPVRSAAQEYHRMRERPWEQTEAERRLSASQWPHASVENERRSSSMTGHGSDRSSTWNGHQAPLMPSAGPADTHFHPRAAAAPWAQGPPQDVTSGPARASSLEATKAAAISRSSSRADHHPVPHTQANLSRSSSRADHHQVSQNQEQPSIGPKTSHMRESREGTDDARDIPVLESVTS